MREERERKRGCWWFACGASDAARLLLSQMLFVVRLGRLLLRLHTIDHRPTKTTLRLLLVVGLSLHACSLLLLDRFQGLSPSGVDKARLDGRGRVQRMPAASETQRRVEKGRQSSI